MAFGRAHFQASWKVSLPPDTSMTTSAPPLSRDCDMSRQSSGSTTWTVGHTIRYLIKSLIRIRHTDFRAHLFHDADHLVPDRDARHCTWNAAVLDVQVAAADAGKGHLDYGILWVLEGWLRLVLQLKMALQNTSGYLQMTA